MSQTNPPNKNDQFLLYTSPAGEIKIEVFFQDETVWLTQKKMGELFGVDKRTISEHLLNIFKDGELSQNSVVRKIRTTASDGKRYETQYYNLDAIISVGYRVNSNRATQFRIWATKTLRNYIIKGFVLDDDRLKNGQYFGQDYFQELLERIRSIRASERRVYQKITDIFAECSVDYDKNSDITKKFYAMVQNKFHFAVSGKTAAEIIYHRADAKKKNMGLRTWKYTPAGRILKSDAVVAKNYLPEKDIKRLERTVSSYFDYLENLVENRVTMTMEYLAESVDKFLSFNEYQILEGKGKISHKKAERKAYAEYDRFNQTQHIESDFDKFTKKILNNKTKKPKKK